MNIFIFNRGLRLYDNTTLIHQTKEMGAISPIFIFTPEQIGNGSNGSNGGNKYFSNNSVQFMIESLHELAKEIQSRGGKLYFFKGDNIDILKSILRDNKIASIGMNFDYTPYARKRANAVSKFCKDNKIVFFEKEDYLLHPILNNETMKKDGTPYLVFTPFKKYCIKELKIPPADTFNKFIFASLKSNKHTIMSSDLSKFYKTNPNINVNGGRQNGLKILKNLKNFSTYQKSRDMLTYNTTFLSAHNHYMTLSIREEYWAVVDKLGKHSGIISELYWREFYTNIVFRFPYVLQRQITNKPNMEFRKKYAKIKLPPFNKKWFDAWCKGTTGFPIVDAAMRQMNLTGFMHNRCRMITMSFLIKFMHIDWRKGEQYFATKLVDYDAMMNNSGVQWTASCGTDAMPYFRFFNPWTQQKTYDPKCIYIKKYIKELQDVDPAIIHKWDTLFEAFGKDGEKGKDGKEGLKGLAPNKEGLKGLAPYPPPILDHSKERLIALKIYKHI
uniref:Photolyase/cryptochrome alpha/beta domain-containing protein n=1 Tax=viral metagenome TaxID=1070528 RepID=A0A6C0I241_9ZZZZ